MSAYLQRLYDAAEVVAEARPAQRSGSPLLVVDQRLAASGYAASFLMGTPGDADRSEVTTEDVVMAQAGMPWPDLTPPADDVRTVTPPRPARDPEPLRPQAPPRAAEPRPAVQPAPAPEPPARPASRVEPVFESRDLPPRRTPAAPVRSTPVPPPPPATDATVIDRRVATPDRSVEVTVEREVPGPPPAPRAVSVPSEPERKEPVPTPADVRAPMRPASARAVDPLPPPATPSPARTAEPPDLADQVRRLVREAMSESRPGPRGTQARDADDVGAAAPSQAPRQSAEQVSVIGPLDRPARSSTLYGLRLR